MTIVAAAPPPTAAARQTLPMHGTSGATGATFAAHVDRRGDASDTATTEAPDSVPPGAGDTPRDEAATRDGAGEDAQPDEGAPRGAAAAALPPVTAGAPAMTESTDFVSAEVDDDVALRPAALMKPDATHLGGVAGASGGEWEVPTIKADADAPGVRPESGAESVAAFRSGGVTAIEGMVATPPGAPAVASDGGAGADPVARLDVSPSEAPPTVPSRGATPAEEHKIIAARALELADTVPSDRNGSLPPGMNRVTAPVDAGVSPSGMTVVVRGSDAVIPIGRELGRGGDPAQPEVDVIDVAATSRVLTVAASAAIGVSVTGNAVAAAVVAQVQPIGDLTDDAPAGGRIDAAIGGLSGAAASPAPSTSPAMPSPVHAPTVAHQLAGAAGHMSRGTIEITLTPEELGRVRMTLTPGEHGLTMAVQADRDDTLALLRRHAIELAQEFRSAGLPNLSFTFGGGGEGARRGPQPGTSQGIPAVAPAAVAAIATTTRIDDRMDIRL